MTNHRATIAIIAGICTLGLTAAATPARAVGGNVAYLSHTGSGTTCSQTAPCASMVLAVINAGTNGEVICLDKGNYGGVSINVPVTISCGDGLWEAPDAGPSINTPAGADVVIEGLVLDGTGVA